MKVTVRQPNREFIVARQTKDVGRVVIHDQTPSFVQTNIEGATSKIIVSKPGIQGQDGSRIYKDNGFPENSVGVPGDYYIDIFLSRLYGPKQVNDTWGTDFVSLGGGASTTFISEEFTVDSIIQNNKYVDLEFSPTFPEDIEFSVFGGIEQRPNIDFQTTANRISWNGLSLEYLLDLGTTFAVRYTI